MLNINLYPFRERRKIRDQHWRQLALVCFIGIGIIFFGFLTRQTYHTCQITIEKNNHLQEQLHRIQLPKDEERCENSVRDFMQHPLFLFKTLSRLSQTVPLDITLKTLTLTADTLTLTGDTAHNEVLVAFNKAWAKQTQWHPEKLIEEEKRDKILFSMQWTNRL